MWGLKVLEEEAAEERDRSKGLGQYLQARNEGSWKEADNRTGRPM